MNMRFIITLLAGAILISALSVVYAKHQSRKLFVELKEIEQQRDGMDEQWGKLQLEQSTWATHGRIEPFAKKRLNMHSPEYEKVVVVRPRGYSK